jgi:transcriptional antiterminator Rof (Rho-off)
VLEPYCLLGCDIYDLVEIHSFFRGTCCLHLQGKRIHHAHKSSMVYKEKKDNQVLWPSQQMTRPSMVKKGVNVGRHNRI